MEWLKIQELEYLDNLASDDTFCKACYFIKKRLQHRWFPTNIAKFLRTPILKDICERLLLEMIVQRKCTKAYCHLGPLPEVFIIANLGHTKSTKN